MALKTVRVPVGRAVVLAVGVAGFLSLPHAASSVRATTGTAMTRTFIPASSLASFSVDSGARAVVDDGAGVGIEEMQARRVDDELYPVALLDLGAGIEPGDDARLPACGRLLDRFQDLLSDVHGQLADVVAD